MNKIAAIVTLGAVSNAKFLDEEAPLKTPTVIFHGINSWCKGREHGELFANHVASVTGAHAECVEVEADFDDTYTAWQYSFFDNFNKYTEAACDAVRKNPNFNSQEFNLVGISQGSLVARNLVENCPDLKVRNFWTIGGPHRGVAAIPKCETGLWCDALNYITSNIEEFDSVQQNVNPATYWRDPNQLDLYLQKSIFLPYLNNEKDFSQQKKDQILKLNHALFVMTNQDDVVYPKESAVFGELQWDGSVLPREETELWKKDLIGLRQLYEEGRATFMAKEGIHVEFSYDWFDQVVLPIFQS